MGTPDVAASAGVPVQYFDSIYCLSGGYKRSPKDDPKVTDPKEVKRRTGEACSTWCDFKQCQQLLADLAQLGYSQPEIEQLFTPDPAKKDLDETLGDGASRAYSVMENKGLVAKYGAQKLLAMLKTISTEAGYFIGWSNYQTQTWTHRSASAKKKPMPPIGQEMEFAKERSFQALAFMAFNDQLEAFGADGITKLAKAAGIFTPEALQLAVDFGDQIKSAPPKAGLLIQVVDRINTGTNYTVDQRLRNFSTLRSNGLLTRIDLAELAAAVKSDSSILESYDQLAALAK